MNIEVFFHTNYASQMNYLDKQGLSDYAKVSFLLYGIGVFCVIGNAETGHVQCQKYVTRGTHSPGTARIIMGVTSDGLYEFKKSSPDNLEEHWASIPRKKRDMLAKCVGYLEHSADMFCDDAPVTPQERNVIRNRIRLTRALFHEMNGDKDVIGLAMMKNDYSLLKKGNYYPVAVNIYSIMDYRLLVNNGEAYVRKDDVEVFLDEDCLQFSKNGV